MFRASFSSRLRAVATFLSVIAVIAFAYPTFGAPPHPNLLKETAAGKKPVSYFMTHEKDLRAAGVNTGKNPYITDARASKPTVDAAGAVIGQFNILAVLVRFPDKNSATAASFFDALMFEASQVSVRHYYRDASYGQLDIVTVNMPSSIGWLTAPQTYSYYTNGASGMDPYAYPQNAQGLVEDVVAMIDGAIDFSSYDNNNDGYVDAMMVIHAGPGAEVTGSDDDIWSHQWAIYPYATNDGVFVSNYTMQPEYMLAPGDQTIGVFVHELGHAFGLPDLYDTDYSSQGVGVWCVMSAGGWLGPDFDGSVPCHPCAWARIQLGFASQTPITANINGQEISEVKATGDIFRLWTAGVAGNEYFLVENRQRTGYDTYLPASGLQIWHIDEAMECNDDEWYPGQNPVYHYLVAMEQCDGQYSMELCADVGDPGDVFPGTGCGNTFNGLTPTNSNSYTQGPTLVAVENISSSGTVMTADLRVSLAGGTDGDNGDVLPIAFSLSQNYPNPFNPTTTVSFYSPDPGYATVEVYNTLGYNVKTLLTGNVSAGYTDVVWDGTNDAGDQVASGIYLYKVEINDEKQVKKMVLVR